MPLQIGREALRPEIEPALKGDYQEPGKQDGGRGDLAVSRISLKRNAN